MNVTRRDILRLAGGSALGLLFTPMPWKLIDDTAIWTQNWSLIPPLPRGPISFKYSVCTLCPGGCAIKARCVANVPVSLAGVPSHPMSKGVLCAMGVGGHHLAYHPLRVAQPMKFDGRSSESKLVPISFEDAITQIACGVSSSNSGEMVAILDQRPGRTLSDVYRRFLDGLPNGFYVNPPARECATIARLQEMTGSGEEFGLDFENVRTVLNFGAPLLDGWGTPGRMLNAFSNRKTTGRRLIHVENCQSRTALQADRWLRIKPGAEAALALGIANVLLANSLFDPTNVNAVSDFIAYRETVAGFDPGTVSAMTGLSEDDIVSITKEIALNGPTIVIAGCDPGGGPLGKTTETAIAGLNVLLGSVGRRGGIVARGEIPGSAKSNSSSHQLNEAPDHSIRVLIIDGAESGYAFPWALVQRKLVTENSIVVSLSPYLGGLATHADYIIPSPAHLELIEEMPHSSDAKVSTYSLSQPLLPFRAGTHDPLEFIKKLAEAIGATVARSFSRDELYRARVNAMYESKRGTVFSPADGSTKAIQDMGSADDLWVVLNKGGVWIDREVEQKPVKRFRLFGVLGRDRDQFRALVKYHSPQSPMLVPVGWKGAASGSHMSPVLSKVFQESGLRNLAGHAAMNPSTASTYGIAGDERVSVRTQNGAMQAMVHLDSSVVVNVIQVAVGPEPNSGNEPSHTDGVLSLCALSDEGTWRVTSATIEKV